MKLARRRPAPADDARPDELEALLRAGQAAQNETDLSSALDGILDAALGLVSGDTGSIQILDRASMTLRVAAGRGLDAEARSQRVALGQGISGTVAAAGEPVLLPSAVDIDRFIGHVVRDRQIYASICVPLRTRGETLGVMSVNQMKAGETFGQHDLRLLTLFAETAAQTITNAQLSSEARRHAVELEILRGAMVRLGSSLDVTTVAETILQEALTLSNTPSAFVAVSPTEDAPANLVRFAGLSRDAMRVVLGRPGFRHLRLPSDIRVIADVAADPVFGPLARELEERALALVPLRASDGRVGGLLGVTVEQPVPERVTRLLGTYGTQAGLALANAALHAAVSTTAEELDTVVRALDLPIVLLDGEDRFRAINPAAASALQLSPEFEVGQDAHGKLPAEMEAIVLGRSDDVTADVAVTVSGEQRAFRVTTATVEAPAGTTRIAAFSDVTNTHELEQHKADFLAVIGHELRTPLTSIKGFAWTLAKRGDDLPAPKRGEITQSIVVQSERLERLIEDLLYVSGIERARPPLHLAWENASEVVSGIIAEVSRRRPDRMIRSNLNGNEEPFYTDRVKVEQILAHLLDNALKFSGEDTFVDVRLDTNDRDVTITVADEGVGIYSRDLERIFEPFVQVDSSATRAAGGTGVGLFVCQTLAEALGGEITVDSVLGRGSAFTVRLPRQSAEPHPE